MQHSTQKCRARGFMMPSLRTSKNVHLRHPREQFCMGQPGGVASVELQDLHWANRQTSYLHDDRRSVGRGRRSTVAAQWLGFFCLIPGLCHRSTLQTLEHRLVTQQLRQLKEPQHRPGTKPRLLGPQSCVAFVAKVLLNSLGLQIVWILPDIATSMPGTWRPSFLALQAPANRCWWSHVLDASAPCCAGNEGRSAVRCGKSWVTWVYPGLRI